MLWNLSPACISVPKSPKHIQWATQWVKHQGQASKRSGFNMLAVCQPLLNLPCIIYSLCSVGIIKTISRALWFSHRLTLWLVDREDSINVSWVVQLHLVLFFDWLSHCPRSVLFFSTDLWTETSCSPVPVWHPHSAASIVSRMPCKTILWP